MSNPKISLIMPTYNRGGIMLDKAINSILSQSFRDFELVIIDDASTDDTQKIVLSKQDVRIKCTKTDHNHGEYWSTNYGMHLALGDYVGWVHSDDMLPPDSLLNRINTFNNHAEIDFVHGDISKVNENDEIIETIPATNDNSNNVFNSYISNLTEGKMVYLVHHTTILMKRGFFYKAGPFDSSLPFAGDIDWMVRALRIGKFTKSPGILYLYRKHSQTRRVVDVQNGIDKVTIHKSIAKRYT